MDFVGKALGALGYFGTAIVTFPADVAADGTVLIQFANRKFKEASINAVQELFTAVLERFPTVLPGLSTGLLLTTTENLIKAVVNALIVQIGGLSTINNTVTSNEINKATLALIWRDSAELGKFLVGLLDPIKCYVLANSGSGIAAPSEEHGTDNELDLTDPMNRHAVICQFQRLVRSVVFILTYMTQDTIQAIDIIPQTKLLSDDQTPGDIMEPSSPTSAMMPQEKWIFVNGIAGELWWLKVACRKLATKYRRDVTGVFNRGDGILWDLIECAGERSLHGSERAASQRQLIQRTASSNNAQLALRSKLEEALAAEGDEKIVVIAHSQGCLLLRLALEDILVGRTSFFPASTRTESDLETYARARQKMRSQLYVFTFGNPSVDWRLETTDITQSEFGTYISRQDPAYLSSYVYRTEHFANDQDFVAKLGVLSSSRPADSGYSNVFINDRPTWIGHLFGTQYSLDPTHYQPNGQISRLLTCVPGQPIPV
ncbi:hypothetical protein DPSP01_012627 [Paraphaeosphaeria sporulosa]